MDKSFSGVPNVFGIADILIGGFDEWSKDHDQTLEKVLWIDRQANLEHNKDKCLFRFTSIPLLGKIISQQGVSLDPSKIQAIIDMPPLKTKKDLQSFLDILNYQRKLLPVAAQVGEPEHKLLLVKPYWTWNRMYQDVYEEGEQ